MHLQAAPPPTFPDTAFDNVPIAFQGRFRDFSAYTTLWWQGLYHSSKIGGKESDALGAKTPEEILWKTHFLGHTPWDKKPLFFITPQLKGFLSLSPAPKRFSYDDLKAATGAPDFLLRQKNLEKENKGDPRLNDLAALLDAMRAYGAMEGGTPSREEHFALTVKGWVKEGLSPKKISGLVEERFPLRERLLQAGETLKALPSKTVKGEWYSLKALLLTKYNAENGRLEPIPNFTPYTNALFDEIRTAYLSLGQAVATGNQAETQVWLRKLSQQLREGFSGLAGKPIVGAQNKTLEYPSAFQLKAEGFYYKTPLVDICLFFYGAALCGFMVAFRLKSERAEKTSLAFFALGLICHTATIALRCYILGRPPVSNMFETVIYVPWVAVLLSLALRPLLKTPVIYIASSTVALILLVLLKTSNLSGSMENVQAVLDSQYWLTIHVMMIVGSYGVFALSGILAHLYIVGALKRRQETPSLNKTAAGILQTLYIGVALLIPGTILGGVWAAQSWGRFWDWDPKESWAFISSCVYLIAIHAYRFKFIGNFGLAMGSILGLLAISFTWYGVNYLLGTGLHSYGFGSGGSGYYYFYLLGEFLFLGVAGFCFSLHKKQKISY